MRRTDSRLPHPFTLATRIAILAGALLTSAARAEIEFVGVLATSQTVRVALTDTSTGKTEWLATGDTFAGYKVRSYDASSDIVTLTSDVVELRLRLKNDAKIKA